MDSNSLSLTSKTLDESSILMRFCSFKEIERILAEEGVSSVDLVPPLTMETKDDFALCMLECFNVVVLGLGFSSPNDAFCPKSGFLFKYD